MFKTAKLFLAKLDTNDSWEKLLKNFSCRTIVQGKEILSLQLIETIKLRSSRPEVFLRKGVLKRCSSKILLRKNPLNKYFFRVTVKTLQ